MLAIQSLSSVPYYGESAMKERSRDVPFHTFHVKYSSCSLKFRRFLLHLFKVFLKNCRLYFGHLVLFQESAFWESEKYQECFFRTFRMLLLIN